jgi:hypothetical protein
MRAAAFETIEPNGPVTSLPFNLHQSPSRSSPFLMLTLAFPAAVAALAPYYLIAAHAAQDASLLIERFETSIMLAFALLIWTLVFGWPLGRRLSQLGTSRTISLARETVTVTENGPFGSKTWSEPVAAYRGIAHHVRSSLSGTRRELLLIHPDPARTLLLRIAEKISQSEIDELAKLLGCREIAPQVYYVNTERKFGLPLAAGDAKLAGVDL